MSEPPETTAQRKQALRVALGVRAERAAAEHLIARGLQILGANVRVGRLEIDLLARDGEVIAVVEVRTRGAGAWGRGLDSIGWKKRKRIRHAGERLWRSRFARNKTVQRMRFDCASVTFAEDRTPTVEYVIAAF